MLILGLFIIICAETGAIFYKTNETDFSKCKVHYSRSGSVYKDFYTISESPGDNDTLMLDFHFTVLAPSDAHILLAPSQDVKKTDPAYEIVIGAGGNTFCDIRRKQKSDVRASVRIKGLLSALDYRSFWLHITKDGDIAVGKEGEELPFMSWSDPDPLPLKVISFSTWSGIEAKWYFDCERKNETEEIEKPLTSHQELRRDLLYHYNPYVRPVRNPTTVTDVTMSLQVNHINLDEHKCVMEVLGIAKLMWHDEKLEWDPEKYGGIDTLHILRREIWQPDFVLYNAVGDTRDLLSNSNMVVHYKGSVAWNPAMSLKVFCDAAEMGLWPNDVHKCNIILGFMQDFTHTRLEFNANESSLISHDFSSWSIREADVLSDLSIRKNTSEPSILQLTFTLKRTSNVQEMLFFSPFILISVSLLSTFWMDPFGNMKISLSCGQLVLTTCMLLALATVIPSHSVRVPYMVTLYSFTMVGLVGALLIAIVVVNVARNKKKIPVPHIIFKILTSGMIRTVLFLPEIKSSDDYGKLSETTQAKIQENQQLMWILVSTAIDRISFVIYLVLVIYALCSKYWIV